MVWWRGVVEAVADVVWPPSCAVCDAVLPGAGWLCDAHRDDVTELPARHCVRCAEPGVFPSSTCERCRAGVPWARAYAPFEHEGAVARAIHRFKYEDRADLSRVLGHSLARQSAAVIGGWGGVVVPLPLHDSRFAERQYDQAALLAQAFCEVSGHRLELGWLQRTRATPRQVGLSEARREANVRGAFAASEAVRGHTVVLVDDVLTSGATAREASRVLLDAGAKEVFVLTLARARSELRSAHEGA